MAVTIATVRLWMLSGVSPSCLLRTIIRFVSETFRLLGSAMARLCLPLTSTSKSSTYSVPLFRTHRMAGDKCSNCLPSWQSKPNNTNIFLLLLEAKYTGGTSGRAFCRDICRKRCPAPGPHSLLSKPLSAKLKCRFLQCLPHVFHAVQMSWAIRSAIAGGHEHATNVSGDPNTMVVH